MRESGPVFFAYYGDRFEAQLHSSVGRTHLGRLKNEMKLKGRKYDRRVIYAAFGVVYTVSSNQWSLGSGLLASIDKVQIYVPPDNKKFGGLYDRIIGFIFIAGKNIIEYVANAELNIELPDGEHIGYKDRIHGGEYQYMMREDVTIMDSYLDTRGTPLTTPGFTDNNAKYIDLKETDGTVDYQFVRIVDYLTDRPPLEDIAYAVFPEVGDDATLASASFGYYTESYAETSGTCGWENEYGGYPVTYEWHVDPTIDVRNLTLVYYNPLYSGIVNIPLGPITMVSIGFMYTGGWVHRVLPFFPDNCNPIDYDPDFDLHHYPGYYVQQVTEQMAMDQVLLSIKNESDIFIEEYNNTPSKVYSYGEFLEINDQSVGEIYRRTDGRGIISHSGLSLGGDEARFTLEKQATGYGTACAFMVPLGTSNNFTYADDVDLSPDDRLEVDEITIDFSYHQTQLEYLKGSATYGQLFTADLGPIKYRISPFTAYQYSTDTFETSKPFGIPIQVDMGRYLVSVTETGLFEDDEQELKEEGTGKFLENNQLYVFTEKNLYSFTFDLEYFGMYLYENYTTYKQVFNYITVDVGKIVEINNPANLFSIIKPPELYE